jgi:hypothetical protein
MSDESSFRRTMKVRRNFFVPVFSIDDCPIIGNAEFEE